MPLVDNRARVYAGASTRIVPPVTGAECVNWPSFEALVVEESKLGRGCTVRAGRGWARRGLAVVEGCCGAAWPVVTGASPNPWPRGGLGQAGGTGFGAVEGVLYLTDSGTWAGSTVKVAQNVVAWSNGLVLVNPVSYPGVAYMPVWIYVENVCGMVGPLGWPWWVQ